MKKLAVLTVTSFLILASCSGDDDGAPVAPGGEGAQPPVITGTLTPEEGKQQLEENAVQLLNNVENFKNDTDLELIVELAEFLTNDNTTSNKQITGFEATAINSISNIAVAQKDIVTANTLQIEETQTTLLQDFNNEKGIYNWNPSLADGEGDFERVGNSDDIIYNIAFNGKNATFSVTDFNTTNAANNTEAPTLAIADLKIDGRTVFSQNYTASIDAGKTIPNRITNTTFIGGFSFITSYTNNNNTTLTQSFEFKIGEEVITGYNYTANGNFANAENEDASLEDVLNNASVSLRFLNATLFVTANDENFAQDRILTIDEEIALLNNNISSELSINGNSIAKGEFYKDQDTFQDFRFNPNTNSFDAVPVTEDIINARFLFADGTSSDFETYIDNSFIQTESKFETVIDAYETLFEDITIDFGSDDDDDAISTPIILPLEYQLSGEWEQTSHLINSTEQNLDGCNDLISFDSTGLGNVLLFSINATNNCEFQNTETFNYNIQSGNADTLGTLTLIFSSTDTQTYEFLLNDSILILTIPDREIVLTYERRN